MTSRIGEITPANNKRWTPVWLRTERWFYPDGTERRAFVVFRRLNLACIVVGVIGIMAVGAYMNVFDWVSIDVHLCPIQIVCQAPCRITADGDIAGIGNFCAIVVLGFCSKEADTQTVRASLVITSVGVTATAAIYAFQGSLSLPHAMVVTSLLTQSLFTIEIVEPLFIRSPALFLTQQLRLFVYAALSVWLAIKAPCLGSDPQCNLCTVVVTFFWKTQAINPIRRTLNFFNSGFVVLFWLDRVSWTYGPKIYLLSFPALVSEKKKKIWLSTLDGTQTLLQRWRASTTWWNVLVKYNLWHEDEQTLHEGLKSRRWKIAPIRSQDRNNLGSLLQIMRLAILIPRIQRSILALLFAAIFTYDTEKVVELNLSGNADEWGYGQIAAMILCGPAVAGVIKLFADALTVERVDIKRAYTL